MRYQEYISKKRISFVASGFDVDPDAINPMMSGRYQYQADITRWNLRRGKAANFLDCGLGKSPLEGEFAHHVHKHTGAPVLVVAPLGVSMQLHREFAKFGHASRIVRDQGEVVDGINITNYEKLAKFDPAVFGGLVLDESSILKGRFGMTRQELNQFGENIPYKLCGTATPAPNDFEELIYHAEFLGVMTEGECKAMFFTQDGNSSNKFRLKKHAEHKFWQWVASWAVAMRKPSDLGYSDDGFELPALNIIPIEIEIPPDELEIDTLFVMEAKGINEQRKFRQSTLNQRVKAVADLVNAADDQWVIWCKYNAESDAVSAAINDAVDVSGSDSAEHKERHLLGFATGETKRLVTKAEIAGFGMNWQNCHNTVLLGWDNSYEQFYQLTRRFWRNGQTKDVNVFIVTTPADGSIIQNMQRKEGQAYTMYREIIRNISMWSDLTSMKRDEIEYNPQMDMSIPGWLKSKDSLPVVTPGIFLYDINETIPHHVNGQLPMALIADGEARQTMIVPEWMKGKNHE